MVPKANSAGGSQQAILTPRSLPDAYLRSLLTTRSLLTPRSLYGRRKHSRTGRKVSRKRSDSVAIKLNLRKTSGNTQERFLL